MSFLRLRKKLSQFRNVASSRIFSDDNVFRPIAEERESVPRTLPRKYISDIEVVSDRKELLRQMPEDGTVAELGVDRGEYSSEIFSVMDPETLYLVDVWDSERYDEECMETVKQRFEDEIDSGKVEVIRERSERALEKFEDNYFDWIYIDTTHGYSQVSKELKICDRKIGEDGMIAGHDYCVGEPHNNRSYGVIAAVHEFCIEYDWKISYLTLETHGYKTFVLERL